MKLISRFKQFGIVLVPVLFMATCASVVTQPDWKFVNSVGGISVDRLELIDGIYYLPVHMSVASYKPGTKSEMVCTNTSTRVAGKQIWLYVNTDSKTNAPNASADCPKAKVGGIPDGKYSVLFVDEKSDKKHRIGEVEANLAGDGGL